MVGRLLCFWEGLFSGAMLFLRSADTHLLIYLSGTKKLNTFHLLHYSRGKTIPHNRRRLKNQWCWVTYCWRLSREVASQALINFWWRLNFPVILVGNELVFVEPGCFLGICLVILKEVLEMDIYRVLKGGCPRGDGNWGTLRIPREP